MLKLGVSKPEQFFSAPPDGLARRLHYYLSRGRVSYWLLETAASTGDNQLFERLMPQVRLSNCTYRTTFRGRFRAFDPAINQILQKHLPSRDNLLVEDWGASACLTSMEWAQSLFPLFPQMQFAATDLLLFLIAAKDNVNGGIFIAEPDGTPLQLIHPPFVTRLNPPEPWTLPVSRVQYYEALSRWKKVRELWPLSEDWLQGSGQWDEPLECGGYTFLRLPLIHPEAFAMARTEPRFSVRRQSIFDRPPVKPHVIRSMNLLNKIYFDETGLRLGVRCALASLQYGGIWIVGRTTSEDPPVHDASLIQRWPDNRLEVVGRIGAGSEIEDVALAAARDS